MLTALHDGFMMGVWIVGGMVGVLTMGSILFIVTAFCWGFVSAIHSFINKVGLS